MRYLGLKAVAGGFLLTLALDTVVGVAYAAWWFSQIPPDVTEEVLDAAMAEFDSPGFYLVDLFLGFVNGVAGAWWTTRKSAPQAVVIHAVALTVVGVLFEAILTWALPGETPPPRWYDPIAMVSIPVAVWTGMRVARRRSQG